MYLFTIIISWLRDRIKETFSLLVLLDLASSQQKGITVTNAEYKSPLWLTNSEYWFDIRCEKTTSCDVVKRHYGQTLISQNAITSKHYCHHTIATHTTMRSKFTSRNHPT
ncbi:MAG: hypothetical protein HRT52_03910 [Colwellia sp.]|nr:hypothetical protein [Colwellia sp.]